MLSVGVEFVFGRAGLVFKSAKLSTSLGLFLVLALVGLCSGVSPKSSNAALIQDELL